jgi:D-aspartate ligase
MTFNSHAVVLSHGTGGLGAVRSLARRGVTVTAIAYDPSDPVLDSRYPVKTYLASGSDDEKESQILRILDELPDHGAAILTNSDRLVALMSRYHDSLSKKFRYQLPPREILDALNDKKQETRLIASLGFDVPKTVQDLPPKPADLEKLLRFPIIFKPFLYVAEKDFPMKNAVIESREALIEFYRHWQKALPVLLAQEVIPGPDSYSWICSCTFDRNHELLDCGIKQKLRAFPAHFGGSTYAVSRTNSDVLELARSLGRKLGYVGHAGIEFRWDARDARYKYLEINPRLPANVGFDEACGLPTVWNSYQISLDGDAVHSGINQKNGIYFLDLEKDFMSLRTDKVPISKILTGYMSLLFKRTNGMYFAWDDPKPAVMLAARFTSRVFRYLVKTINTKMPYSVRPAKY